MKTLRIGAGAGFASDRIDPAVDLAQRGQLDYLVFECLAERTIALSQLRKRQNPTLGYDPMLEPRMRAVLPACRKHGTRILSNMGAANPRAAAQRTIEIAQQLGLRGLRVACLEGDDVLLAHAPSFLPFDDEPLPDSAQILTANAYLGADAIAQALATGADVVLTGRVADPSLFVGAFLHTFGWSQQDWNRLGQATAVGHLLECAGQLTGGYFADPGFKDVPHLERLGFPLAQVSEDASAQLSKLPGTGGVLDLQTCREQILYEVMDPSAYLTPDVAADFTTLRFTQQGQDRVHVCGATGRPRPDHYKLSIGVEDGYLAEAQISYAGPGALARARLASSILRSRLDHLQPAQLRLDLHGVQAIFGESASPDGTPAASAAEPSEIRLRAAARFHDPAHPALAEQRAAELTREVESLYLNGPAGGCGVTSSVRHNIAIVPGLIPRDCVRTTVTLLEVP